MREFIEKNPAIVIVFAIIFGCFAFLVAGVNLHIMLGMASVGSKQIFIMILCCIVGSLFTVLPITILYDIIAKKELDIALWQRRNANAGTTTTAPRRRGESDHWQANIDIDDDLDGDGNNDDSLRRLGAIQ